MPKGRTSRRRYLRTVGLAGLGALAGCVGEDGDGEPTPNATPDATETRDSAGPPRSGPKTWPQVQFDAANTASGGTVGPRESLVERWTVEAADTVGAPVLGDGTIFVADWDDRVHAIDAATGEHEWWLDSETPYPGPPTYVDGTVYLPGYDDALTAVDAASGDELWQTPLQRTTGTAPTVADGRVYCADEHELVAFDAETGERLWGVDVRETAQTTAVVDGTVYYAGIGREAYAFDAATGKRRWSFSIETGGSFTPAVVVPAPGRVDADRLVVFGDSTYEDSKLYALDAATGRPVWTDQRDGYVRASPAVAGDTVYVGDRGDVVSALDLATGAEQWTTGVNGYVEAAPAVTQTAVYVSNVHGELFALDRARGSVLWRTRGSGRASFALAVADGTVFFPTGNRLIALSAEWALPPGTESTRTDGDPDRLGR